MNIERPKLADFERGFHQRAPKDFDLECTARASSFSRGGRGVWLPDCCNI